MKKIVRGAIYYADLDPTVVSEEKGCRPVVILQNNIGNKFSTTTLIAPISTKNYKGKTQPTHIEIKQLENIRPGSILLLEQIRTIDKVRIKGFIDYLNEEQMKMVDKALMISLGLTSKKKEENNCKN